MCRRSDAQFFGAAILLGFILATFHLAAAQTAGAPHADFYVSPTGSDNSSGALDAPFATLERARRAVGQVKSAPRSTPIVVMLRGGIYFLDQPLHFTSADSGSPQAPVIYQAYPGEKPVISGGRRITGWQAASGRWTVTLDPSFQNFEQLFVNDARRYRPRTSKQEYLYNDGPVVMNSPGGFCQTFSQAAGGYVCFDRFRFKAGDVRDNYANLGDVEIDDFEKWTMSKLRLRSVDTSAGIAYLTGPAFHNAENSGFLPGHRYLIENVKEALSDPGEWYLDRSASPWTLTYIPKASEKPDTAVIIAPQQARLVTAEDLAYVAFKEITFEHDNWVVPEGGHASLQSEPTVAAALSFSNANHVTIDGCTIAHTGGWGVDFIAGQNGPSHHNQVVNSVLYDLGAGGVRVGAYHLREDTEDNVSHDNLIQNNLIASGGRILPSGIGTGVWIGNSPHNTVTHNEIYDFYGGGIGICVPTPHACPFPHDNTISFNRVYQQGQGVTSDFGAIYLATYEATGNKVLNNWVHDVTGYSQDPGGAHGIYLDNITSNVLVENNLVYRVSHTGIFNNRGANNTFTNNIFAYTRLATAQKGGLTPGMGRNNRQQERPIGGRLPGQGPYGRQRQQPPESLQQADPNKPAFIFTRNVVLFDKGAIQKTPGFWVCAHPETHAPVPCAERFQFDSNLYWNPDRQPPTFATSDVQNPRTATDHALSDWQKLGEDEHSINEDPRFTNPKYPADNFTLPADSPAKKVGFILFDYKQAGTTTPLTRPPAQPPAFPLQLLDPSDF